MASASASHAASALARATGRLSRKSSALFICDMQKRFEPVMPKMDVLLRKSVMMVDAAAELGIPVVVTEQTPDKLLPTCDVLLDAIPAGTRIFEKSSFSMITPEVSDYLASGLGHVKSVILCGIETHICVAQTALDLIDRGYDVHLVADACASQRESDRQIAFKVRRLGYCLLAGRTGG